MFLIEVLREWLLAAVLDDHVENLRSGDRGEADLGVWAPLDRKITERTIFRLSWFRLCGGPTSGRTRTAPSRSFVRPIQPHGHGWADAYFYSYIPMLLPSSQTLPA